jgi:hypothetical protein
VSKIDVKDQIRLTAESSLEASSEYCNSATDVKICSCCNISKRRNAFGSRGNGLLKSKCKECENNWQKANYNPLKKKDQNLRREHGIDLEEYNAKLINQDFRCALCSVHITEAVKGQLHVDHCHASGKTRELLCMKCNTALGKVNDDVSLLKRMIDYIEKHRR